MVEKRSVIRVLAMATLLAQVQRPLNISTRKLKNDLFIYN